MAWNLVDVLDNWNTENVQLPKSYYHGLCVLDWRTQQHIAETYRERELPFIVKNHPAIMQTAERWMSPNYLENLLGDTPTLTEWSATSFFTFARLGLGDGQAVIDPATLTKKKMHTFPEFKARAVDLERMVAAGGSEAQAKEEHLCFRLNGRRGKKEGQSGRHEFLYDELPFFDVSGGATSANEFFMVEKKVDRGIHCRFGMAGVTSPMHFDYDRNFLAVFGGKRRVILVRGESCRAGLTIVFSHQATMQRCACCTLYSQLICPPPCFHLCRPTQISARA